MILLVTVYRRPNRALEEFAHTIAKGARSFWKVTPDVWMVDTPESINTWYARLRPLLRQEDDLLVIRVTRDYACWLPGDASTWLRISLQNGDFEKET